MVANIQRILICFDNKYLFPSLIFFRKLFMPIEKPSDDESGSTLLVDVAIFHRFRHCALASELDQITMIGANIPCNTDITTNTQYIYGT